MSESITDANDCIVKVGSSQAGGTKGRLIISSFDIDVNKNRSRKWGLGNRDAQGRTNGNREIDLSFTHEGEDPDLVDDLESGNFSVVLLSRKHRWRLPDVDGSYTISVDDEEFTMDFDGDSLGYSSEQR